MIKLTLLASLFLGACSVGEVMTGGDGDNGLTPDSDNTLPDSSGSATPDAAPSDLTKVCAPAGVPGTAHDHGGGDTKAGKSCMSGAGCHGTAGGAAPLWTMAGTAYTATAGTTPMAGATIRILSTDLKTVIARTVTDDAGNFSMGTALPTQGPYVVDITECGKTPDEHRMAATVTNFNCNNGTACHAMPGPQPIYLAP